MPVHDWSRVDAGIFHHFHHAWIEEIQRALNAGLLPDEYYALSEQYAGGFGPDVLTLQESGSENEPKLRAGSVNNRQGVLLAPPKVQLTAETDMDFYRRKEKAIVVHHVSGDRIVAMVEVVSPGNKAGRKPMRAFLDKTCQLLDQGIHLLILDLQPRTRRDPHGIHAAIWEDITGDECDGPADKPFTLGSYEVALAIKAYIRHVAIGDTLVDMPLFLEPGAHIQVPLEATYQKAFAAVPRRWRAVLEKPAS